MMTRCARCRGQMIQQHEVARVSSFNCLACGELRFETAPAEDDEQALMDRLREEFLNQPRRHKPGPKVGFKLAAPTTVGSV